MISRKVIVCNESGLHVRPASVLAKAAESCGSRVEIRYKHNIINAKSLLNIVAAAIVTGDEVELQCSGPNEKADMEKMVDIMQHLE